MEYKNKYLKYKFKYFTSKHKIEKHLSGGGGVEYIKNNEDDKYLELCNKDIRSIKNRSRHSQMYETIDSLINEILPNILDSIMDQRPTDSFEVICGYVYMYIQKKIIDLLFTITEQSDDSQIQAYCILAMNFCIDCLKRCSYHNHFYILHYYLRTSSGLHRDDKWDGLGLSFNLHNTFININRERMRNIILLYIREKIPFEISTSDYIKKYNHNLRTNLDTLVCLGALDEYKRDALLENQTDYEYSKLGVLDEFDCPVVNISYEDGELISRTMGGTPVTLSSNCLEFTFNELSRNLHTKLVDAGLISADRRLSIVFKNEGVKLEYGKTKIIDIIIENPLTSQYADDNPWRY